MMLLDIFAKEKSDESDQLFVLFLNILFHATKDNFSCHPLFQAQLTNMHQSEIRRDCKNK